MPCLSQLPALALFLSPACYPSARLEFCHVPSLHLKKSPPSSPPFAYIYSSLQMLCQCPNYRGDLVPCHTSRLPCFGHFPLFSPSSNILYNPIYSLLSIAPPPPSQVSVGSTEVGVFITKPQTAKGQCHGEPSVKKKNIFN